MPIIGRVHITFIDSRNGTKIKKNIGEIKHVYGSDGTTAYQFNNGSVIVEDIEAIDEYSCSYKIKEFDSWEKYVHWIHVRFLNRLPDDGGK